MSRQEELLTEEAQGGIVSNRRQRESCSFTHTWCRWNALSHLWKSETWRFVCRGLAVFWTELESLLLLVTFPTSPRVKSVLLPLIVPRSIIASCLPKAYSPPNISVTSGRNTGHIGVPILALACSSCVTLATSFNISASWFSYQGHEADKIVCLLKLIWGICYIWQVPCPKM